MKISIIIPVYNSDKYLEKCLTSCLNQTLKEIEIILINDASPDDSRTIIGKYEKEYPERVKCIDLKENMRQGVARNIGIKTAKADYLMFVDSDDWIEEEMCQKLYEEATKENYDIVFADMYMHRHEGILISNEFPGHLIGDSSVKKMKGRILNMRTSPCGFIIKRSIFEDKNLLFPEDFLSSEDGAVTPVWRLIAKKVGKINKPYYHYRKNYLSPTQTRVREGNIKGDFLWIKYVLERMREVFGEEINVYREEIQVSLEYFLIKSLSSSIQMLGKGFYSDIDNAYDEVNNVLSELCDKNRYYSIWFTKTQRKTINKGAQYFRQPDEEDYVLFYKDNKKRVEEVMEIYGLAGENAVVWSNTLFAKGFRKVFSEYDIVDEKTGNIETENSIISLSTWHNSNIHYYYPQNKIVDLQNALLEM